ncbi:hypothetical protein QNI19_18540 [Cytophagaceae bacterium DM2B3-1]|uniref:Uncharacterized protein n=1 Tax=Xanthocytophaga flava TaxID=3048013 RepID=A0ABT7CMF9_9BACT|nr:hypothetical protein [Xanthocytophaga flavus]MDJ1494943.1 hypothetical protein [Xanthocytophaga flavus]
MKSVIICLLLLTSSYVFAQNENTLSVQIDGKEFKTAPRRIRMGSVWYITANAVKPDKSLRFWFANFNKTELPEVGQYLIVEENYSNKEIKQLAAEGKYKGIAFVKYVEETKTPRMEYHVGKSRHTNGGVIEVTTSNTNVIEGKFTANLDGTHFKEKATATAFGGVGRIINKMEDKAVTSATGYDSDIDPEGNGYKRTDQKDELVLTSGVFRLQLTKTEPAK